jgi:hypothetical protein
MNRTSTIKGRWQPGESGNPSDHPKVPQHVRDAARAQTELAIETPVKVCKRGSMATCFLKRLPLPNDFDNARGTR